MVLRCMEDDFQAETPPISEVGINPFHYQAMLSELWIGAIYEVFRLLIDRKLAPNDQTFTAIAHELRLLRISLEKHEIAADRKLLGPLQMTRQPPKNNESDLYSYRL